MGYNNLKPDFQKKMTFNDTRYKTTERLQNEIATIARYTQEAQELRQKEIETEAEYLALKKKIDDLMFEEDVLISKLESLRNKISS